jgi:hypothetical protein
VQKLGYLSRHFTNESSNGRRNTPTSVVGPQSHHHALKLGAPAVDASQLREEAFLFPVAHLGQ